MAARLSSATAIVVHGASVENNTELAVHPLSLMSLAFQKRHSFALAQLRATARRVEEEEKLGSALLRLSITVKAE